MFILRSIFLAYRVFFFSFMAILFFMKILLARVFGIKYRKIQKNKMTMFYGNVDKNSMFRTNLKKIDSPEKQTDDFIIKLGGDAIFSNVDDKKILFNPKFNVENRKVFLSCDVIKKDKVDEKEIIIPKIVKLPETNYMFVSQSHLEYLGHLNRSTVNYINSKIDAIVCPSGVGKYLKVLGFDSVKEVNKNKKIKLDKDLETKINYSNSKRSLDDFLLENKKYKIIYKKNTLNPINIEKKHNNKNSIKIFNNSERNIRRLNNKNTTQQKNNDKRQLTY